MMAVSITGQRWKVLDYSAAVAAVPQDGEAYVLSGVPGFAAPRVMVIGDAVKTVAELVAMRQYQPIYDYEDVSADTPEAGHQVALINAPDTELYVVVVTGDGSHTIAQLVTNFNANLSSVADAAAAAASAIQVFNETAFDAWAPGHAYKAGKIVWNPSDGLIYRCHADVSVIESTEPDYADPLIEGVKWDWISGIKVIEDATSKTELHPDGSQKEWVDATLSDTVFTLATAPIAASPVIVPADWPVPFHSIKRAFSALQYASSTCWVVVGLTDATITKPPYYYMYRSGAGTVTTIKTVLYGEGRWKA